MRRPFVSIPLVLLLLSVLSGCSKIGDKAATLSTVYAAAVVLAFVILLGYFCVSRGKNIWLLLLFSSVLIVNTGYFWLSVSSALEQALMANRLSYLGSVLLPLSMLMIILEVTGVQYRKRLLYILFGISALVFLIAASPGILDIYYREVSFAVVNGVSTLVKVYGPLHPLYLFFLLGYFAAMVAVIVRASVKKQVDSAAHSVILAVAVFVNIGVWLIEQLSQIEFEMLSVSYIISELFLLGVHLMANENKRLSQLAQDAQTVQSFVPVEAGSAVGMRVQPDGTVKPDHEHCRMFVEGLQKLTQTETAIYEAYVARVTTREIMASLNITENTLKFHNKNLYSKLGVSSRKELLEIYKQLAAMKGSDAGMADSAH